MNLPNVTRTQLTLFLSPPESHQIECIRKQFNPIQYNLIQSHITLCREDELTDAKRVMHNLQSLHFPKFNLRIGRLKRFSDGKGLLLSIYDSDGIFKKLRKTVLNGTKLGFRDHLAHITLMHPRNSTCTDRIFDEIKCMTLPTTVNIDHVSMIKQTIGEAWQIMNSYHLK